MNLMPATLQTTYANLLQAHLSRPVFEFAGSPFKLERSGKTYWYANQRGVGAASPKQRYLGPDTEEMRGRIEKMQSAAENAADFRSHCSRMVAQLRAGGILGIDRETGSALRALQRSGVFRLGGTLVGTHAFRHYDLELGVMLTSGDEADRQLTETQDLDIASFERLSTVIGDQADPDLSATLAGLGFEHANSLDPKRPTSWRHAQSSYAIDFLTPSFEERQGPRRLEALNLWAQGLHYLDFLIKDPMPAVSLYMEGILVQVPRPERYAIHKLIISQKRSAGSGIKARKDLQQARALIWAMAETHAYQLHSALAEADSRGKQWREALDRALHVTFSAPVLGFDFDRDIVQFDGRALGRKINFAVSGEALEDHFGASDNTSAARLESAGSNRSRIQDLAARKFRVEPSPEQILTSADVEQFSGA